MATETLSQNDIDRLLVGGVRMTPTSSASRDVHVYDWRRPPRVSKERQRTVEAMYERLAKGLETWIDREHESLRVARQDIRLVLAVGTEAARRREFARAQRLQAIVLAGIAVLSISTLARRRSSRPTPNPVDTISVLHYFRVMKNVTITLDDDVARWARIRAAELDTSVSRMLGELLRQQMRRQITYQTERQQYLVREARPLSAAGSVYPSRDDLHDRSGLR